MSLQRHYTLVTEIFKTLNNLNPKYMSDIFIRNNNNPRNPNNLIRPKVNSFTYGINSIRNQGPAIWNLLPSNIKEATSLSHFKSLIKSWDGSKCNCRSCSITNVLQAPLLLLVITTLTFIYSILSILFNQHLTLFKNLY